MESHLLGLYPKDLGMTWMDWEALMGAPQGGWPATCVGLHGAPLPSPLCPSCVTFAWAFWVFVSHPYPLAFL